ncbi:hypothetical protein EVAR_85773_1 [Eumeta japonica]|uniref:CHK kinase-like domain-containing protein n=1 Tax=Eumeta variegata TaxID=151549 RepID=A0A4C1ZZK1_EUMVA|nr:hypothetical protein EVAR_85773_1 [Eumeta japonica]
MNGKLESLIPVDYQTLQAGGQLIDLLYFIVSGTDGEFRRLHHKRLIQHYYDSFAGFLTKLGLDPEVVYPKRHFDEDYKEYLPFGLILAMFILPIVLVESENAPTMEGDAKITDMLIKPNDVAHKRFLEVVENYVNWGVL